MKDLNHIAACEDVQLCETDQERVKLLRYTYELSVRRSIKWLESQKLLSGLGIEEIILNKPHKRPGRPTKLSEKAENIVTEIVEAYASNQDWITYSELQELVFFSSLLKIFFFNFLQTFSFFFLHCAITHCVMPTGVQGLAGRSQGSFARPSHYNFHELCQTICETPRTYC